jgi:hypothetical protein
MNSFLIGMICLLAFWFISLFIPKIIRGISQ